MRYFRDLHETDKVELIGNSYYHVRHTPAGGKVADLIYWHGTETKEASERIQHLVWTQGRKGYDD